MDALKDEIKAMGLRPGRGGGRGGRLGPKPRSRSVSKAGLRRSRQRKLSEISVASKEAITKMVRPDLGESGMAEEIRHAK